MELELLTKNTEQVDNLTDLVYDLVEESGFKIIPQGGARLNTVPIDYEISDFHSNKKRIGRYEYRLKNGVYQIKLELQITEVYDKILTRITKRLNTDVKI